VKGEVKLSDLNISLDGKRNHENQSQIKIKLKNTWKKLKKTKYLQLMIIPGIIYFIIFHYIPMYGIIIAFKDYNMKLGILGSRWVGFENFVRFFNHPHFFRLVRNTFLLNLYNLIWSFPAPIILALFLNEVRNLTYKKIVQTVSYLPHFISTVSVVGIIFMLLSPQGGLVNNVLGKLFNIEPIYFVAEPKWFRTIFIVSGIWQNVGWDAIIYIAALTAINYELYEAATIDGASRFKQMLHISIPGILPTISIMLILRIGGMMSSNTDKVLLLQLPITYEVSDVIGTYVYRRGLVMSEYSFSTAVDLFNNVINIILLVIANTVSRKVSENSLW